MTKVQLDFHLQRPLDDRMMQRIASANAIYGIERIQVQPSLEDLTVEYDASRLRPSEVHAALTGAGIPAVAKNQNSA